MTGANLSSVYAFGNLKEMYSEDAKYQGNIEHSFHNFLKHAGPGEVNYDGNGFSMAKVFGLNESYGAINDSERLPLSGDQKGAFAKWLPKFHYSAIQATMQAATRGHSGGRVGGKYMDDLVKGSFLTFMSNLDFDTYGNGRGIRAEVSAATAAATSFTVETSKKLRPGMKLDWYSSDLTTKKGTIEIASSGIDRQAKTPIIRPDFMTGAVPAGAVAGDKLVVIGALDAGEPVDGRYAGGYARCVDNSLASFGDLSPSTWQDWRATNWDAAGANPNYMALQEHWDIFREISGAYPDRMVFHPAFKRGYLQSFLGQRKFGSNSFDTGARHLSVDFVNMGETPKGKRPVEITMLEDSNCDADKTLIYAHDALCVATDYTNAPKLADEDGTEFRNQQGYDAMSGYVRFWWNIVVDQRNAIGQISNWAVSGRRI